MVEHREQRRVKQLERAASARARQRRRERRRADPVFSVVEALNSSSDDDTESSDDDETMGERLARKSRRGADPEAHRGRLNVVHDMTKDVALIDMNDDGRVDLTEFKAAMGHRSDIYASLFSKLSALQMALLAEPLQRTNAHIAMIANLLQDYSFYRLLAPDSQLDLCRVIEYRTAESGVIVVQEGERTGSLFMVLSGSLVVKVLDKTIGVEKKMGVIHAGEVCGELALIHGTAANASVYIQNPAEILEISKDNCERLKLASILRQDVEDRENTICMLFKDVHMFDVQQVARSARLQTFLAGAVILRQGDPSLKLYILKRGCCRVRKRFNMKSVFQHRIAELEQMIKDNGENYIFHHSLMHPSIRRMSSIQSLPDGTSKTLPERNLIKWEAELAETREQLAQSSVLASDKTRKEIEICTIMSPAFFGEYV